MGGHIESNEYPLEAMKRESIEEAGIDINWKYSGLLYKPNIFKVYVFFAYSNEIFNFQQKEDEIINIYNTAEVLNEKVIHNLYFIIPYGIIETPIKNMILKY
ncbi:MAG: NUDIX hydrolase [Candidatus Woesearchaeota archaeon]